MSNPSAAVIILNWNGEKLLREFLPSVVENTPSELARVVVADNGSTDGSVALLRSEFPSVELLEFPENYGFAEGYNRALEQVGAELSLLLNSDVKVTEGWLEPLLEFMAENGDVAACQPKIRAYRNPEKFEYAGACGGYLDRNGYPYCRGRIFSSLERDNGQYDVLRTDLFWATGAALLVRTELYNRAGGLDPLFFAHMEEIDLCWRLRLMGYRIGVVPESVVYHLGGGSLDSSNPKKTYLNFRNNLLMLHKNLPVKVRGRKLLKRRMLDTMAWGLYVAKGQWKNAGAVWRAHRDFAKMRKNYNLSPDADLLADKRLPNILVEYYARGKRKFSDL